MPRLQKHRQSSFPKTKKRTAQIERKKVIISESRRSALLHSLIHLFPFLTSIAILAINIHGIYLGVDIPGPLKSDTIAIMFLQLAAKAHEILIVASLGLIVVQTVRHELLFGDGLPLGLIGSGIAFSNFEFFFKKEFYGALKYVTYHGGNRARKIGFVALLIVSGLTAVLAGPASAVLLVPKDQTYPSGSSAFYLPGTASQLWPDDLSGDMSELQRYCADGNSTALSICPAGGFLSLLSRWSTASNPANPLTQTTVPAYAADLTGSHFYWPIHSPSAPEMPPLYTLGNTRPDPNATDISQSFTFLVQAHAASAVLLHRLASDWWKAISSKIDPLRIADRNIKAEDTRAAIAAVRCAEPLDVVFSEDADRNGTVTVQFPTMHDRFNWAENQGLEVDVLNSTATTTDANRVVRFQWTHLPAPQFGALSIGAVAVFSSSSSPPPSPSSSSAPNNPNRNPPAAAEAETPRPRTATIIGCSAQTGWVPAQLLSDQYSFWTGFYPFGIRFGERMPAWSAAGAEAGEETNGRIKLGDEWLGMLTPRAPTATATMMGGFDSDDDNDDSSQQQKSSSFSTTIETLLAAAGLSEKGSTTTTTTTTFREDWIASDTLPNAGKTRLLEAIIASVLADGLSRSGSYLVFNTSSSSASSPSASSSSDDPSTWPLLSSLYSPLPTFNHTILQPHSQSPSSLRNPSPKGKGGGANITTLYATFSLTGYSFRITLAGYLAMVVLLAHMALATAHTVWVVGFSKRASRSWGSVAEWIALARNSGGGGGRGGGGRGGGALVNTGAGIGCLATFARVARVRVRRDGNGNGDGEGEGGEHVELIFEEDWSRDRERGDGGGVGGVDDDPDGHASGVQRASTTSLNAFSAAGPGGRLSWTFPLDPGRAFAAHGDLEMQSQSSATERLIPRVHLADDGDDDEKKRGIVRVNQAYG